MNHAKKLLLLISICGACASNSMYAAKHNQLTHEKLYLQEINKHPSICNTAVVAELEVKLLEKYNDHGVHFYDCWIVRKWAKASDSVKNQYAFEAFPFCDFMRENFSYLIEATDDADNEYSPEDDNNFDGAADNSERDDNSDYSDGADFRAPAQEDDEDYDVYSDGADFRAPQTTSLQIIE